MQIGEAVVSGASQGPKGGVLAVFLIGAPLMAWNSRPFDPSKVAAWIEDFPGSKTTIKQKLAAVRIRTIFWSFGKSQHQTRPTRFAVQST
jgi:hypothetical protein